MSETTTRDATSSTPHPSGLLMTLIVAFLAPMFLGVTGGDVALARMAAVETVNDYRARTHADLIAVAQIIAFGLAAIGSLSLSMADDISISMALRLRGNANALNRSAERNRRVLRESVVTELMLHHAELAEQPASAATCAADDAPDPDVFLTPAAEQLLAAEAQARLRHPEENIPTPLASDKRHREMWAIALVKEAGQITASIPNLPPAEQAAATIRAAELAGTAHDLLYGDKVPQLDPATVAGITRPGAGGNQPRL